MNLLNVPISLKTKNGSTIKVDKEGSLGLLALGDIGVQLWRREKIAYHKSTEASISKDNFSTPKPEAT